VTLERHIGKDGKIKAPNIGRMGPVPIVQPLPDIAGLVALDNDDLIAVLQRFGVVPSFDDLKIGAMDVAARLRRTPYVDAETWADRMGTEVERHARGRLLGLARRTVERYQTAEAVGGDPKVTLVRISEGDDHVCENCDALEGAEGTYEEHEAIGLPGAGSCLGEDKCRCRLLRVE